MKTFNIFLLTSLVWTFSSFSSYTQYNPTIVANQVGNGLVSYQLSNIGQNTFVFTLFGDGTFSTLQNPTHVFAPNQNGYTTESYFARSYDPNVPPKRTAQTGPIGTYTNSTTISNTSVNMTGSVDVFTSWATAQNYENFYIIAFQNITSPMAVDGCLEFYYNHQEITVNPTGIKIYNNWVNNQQITSALGNYTSKIQWTFKDLQLNETRYVYIPAVTHATLGQDIHIDVRYNENCDKRPISSPHTFKSRKYPHDPNYKIVNKECTKERISIQQELIYTIGFFNDGEYFAEDVFVVDELDSALDASTAQLVDYEVKPNFSITDNALFFDFLNINLPGTNQIVPKMYTYDEAATYFSFKICTQKNLDECINNTASIVFDTQPVFYTNTSQICAISDCPNYTSCTDSSKKENASETALFEENESTQLKFSVFPNPTNDVLNVTVIFTGSTVKEFSLTLRDFSGKEIKTSYIENQNTSIFNKTIPLKNVVNGLYFLTLSTNQGNYTKKIIKN
ncbi:hypothetical protein KORDIASMS9_03848 [Kordia sp. SMS9]|uniref:T9SS type A sorting domain-containing protein n=1 Tax=Kordia sp. SMS9 TaxID=2282170 RepID=UPI000E0DCF43|nr:T9SS type A sorting domain-containing protein [Kordia sp. SMS9]AXG71591.1 hypothetical protein KORDIASMS9_03848 [Kordia sp. SMS9]